VYGWFVVVDVFVLVVWGVVVVFVVGKVVGVFGGIWFIVRFTWVEFDEGLEWGDVVGLLLFVGIGFMVSLFIGELVFGEGSFCDDYVKVVVFAGLLLAVAFAVVVLCCCDCVYCCFVEVEFVMF